MSIVLTLGAVALLAGGCDALARRDQLAERQLAGVGTVRVPSRLEVRPNPLNDWYGTSLYLTRPMNSFAAMGSNSPQHENLLVTQLHPAMEAPPVLAATLAFEMFPGHTVTLLRFESITNAAEVRAKLMTGALARSDVSHQLHCSRKSTSLSRQARWRSPSSIQR